MSTRLKRNFKLLKLLQKASPKKRKLILHNASSDLVLCIAEIIDNVLRGHVNMPKKKLKQLSKYKKVLRSVANKKVPVNSKRKILNQRGGFLSALLGPVIGVIGSLLGGALGK